jgi:hypothetical protein
LALRRAAAALAFLDPLGVLLNCIDVRGPSEIIWHGESMRTKMQMCDGFLVVVVVVVVVYCNCVELKNLCSLL